VVALQIVILSGIIAALVSALVAASVAMKIARESTARELMRLAMQLQDMEEAWVLVSPLGSTAALSHYRHLEKDGDQQDGHTLRLVELRAVLDEAAWNPPEIEPIPTLQRRRRWIVRDIVTSERDYRGNQSDGFYPAMISSRGMQELVAWIKLVASAHRGLMLSGRGLQMLSHLLLAVSHERRIAAMEPWFSKNDPAVRFLKRIGKTLRR
jgi:hypothetical protein